MVGYLFFKKWTFYFRTVSDFQNYYEDSTEYLFVFALYLSLKIFVAISVAWVVVGSNGAHGADCGVTGLNILCEKNLGILWYAIWY